MATGYRPPATPAERRRAEEARAEKLQALHDRLTEQVAALRSGEDWQRWLTTAARFHTYSFHNTLLILAQRPDATAVAGYEMWKTLGRQVGKGEKGIAILAPVLTRSPQDTQPPVGAPEPAQSRDAEPSPPDARRLVGYRVTHVWDVAQTTGTPLPAQPTPQLVTGEAPPGLWDTLTGLVDAAGYRVERGPCWTANGVTIPATRTVRIRDDVDGAQAVKTLAHELAHVHLHTASGAVACRGVAEVEAESVAYLVAAVHGLDTAGYSFPYVAHWAGRADGGPDADAVVRATGQRVLTAARWILDHTTTAPPQPTHRLDAEMLADRVHTSRVAASALQARAEHASDITRDLTPASPTRRPGASPQPPARAVPRAEVGPDELIDIHEQAVAFYRACVQDSWVPDYLDARSLAVALDDPWAAGYAPAGWTALVDHLRRTGADDAVLLASGLATRSSRGTLIDRFRDRLVLPLRNPIGDVVALIARAHPAASPEAGPRYLNSPQSPVYSKSALLYGLPEARELLARGARPVLVEGPLDAIAVTAGTGGRCIGLAACGTALTRQHLDALARVVDLSQAGVVVATDPDPAGRHAAGASLDLCLALGITPAAAVLPEGLDPADVLHRHGPAALTAAVLDRAQPLADVVIDDRIHRWNDQLQWIQGRVGAIRDVAPLVARLPIDDIRVQATRLAARLDLQLGVVQREIAAHIGVPAPVRPARRGMDGAPGPPRREPVGTTPHRRTR